MSSVSDTLKAVRELLGPEGENWRHGVGGDKKCLFSATSVVVDHDQRAERAAFAFLDKVAPRKPRGVRHIRRAPYFNDTHEWPDVKALLDRAIEEAERQGI